jgi:ABC-2 type transport system permease protein
MSDFQLEHLNTPEIQAKMLEPSFIDRNRPSRPSPLSASLTLGWRALLKIKHVPWQLIDVIMYPILITLMFTYIFGGALAGSVTEYVQRLVPGILVQIVAMISMHTALGLNTDIAKGIFDRFRSLPFWRPAVLVGALLGDAMRYMVGGSVVIGLGLILGLRPGAGIEGVLLSLGIVLIFAFSLSWIWTTVGLLVDNPESVSMISSLSTFPLTFISNVFVDPSTMPPLLQSIANLNPISLTTTAVRGLMAGNATGNEVIQVFIACLILIGVFAPLSIHLYNSKNTS